ncbi:MAG: hypothetical protein SWH61_14875 [Thermodesulfobacteriota bacterium]|nr:hypothetical protein [Thermodesulfobacteriota bacterium]
MEDALATTCAEGLAFFSKTNRLISHELKNILAIISETLGLMEELTSLANAGKALTPGKLESLSASIIEEVERANTLTRGMNTFAHTVDELSADVDVRQAVMLIVQLSQLDADIKHTGVKVAPGDPCRTHTSSFFLQNLIYSILKHGSGEPPAGGEKGITVSVANAGSGVQIAFSNLAEGATASFPTEKQVFMAKMLSAELITDSGTNTITIALPEKPEDRIIEQIASPLSDDT